MDEYTVDLPADRFRRPVEHAELRRERVRSCIAELAAEVLGQAAEVFERHGELNSAHEAYGVLAEEVAELLDEVRKRPGMRSRQALRRECIDIAAVALRYAAQLEADGNEYDGGPR